MPAFGDQLSDAQIALVTAYIKTMWSDEQRTSQQQTVAATRQNPLMIQPPGN